MNMKFFLLTSLVLTIFTSNVYSFESIETLKQKAYYINNLGTTWTATYENVPTNLTLGAYLGRNGVNLEIVNDVADNIPEEFDARKNWPECQEITGHIRDQGSCGSCWAFAAASTISDRICIASKGQKKLSISAVDLVSCCSSCGDGCHGGYPLAAMSYYVKNGLVSGGDYGDKSTCRPYVFPECSHHVIGPKPSCQGYKDTPKCERKCINGADYKKDLHFGSKAYGISESVEAIQTEIMKHGSVEAAFSVYDDFPLYKSGVYQKTPKAQLKSGHAVKVIGWGVENGTPYWLVVNSWNDTWGDKGYFKMIRGIDHCGFESDMVASLPKL